LSTYDDSVEEFFPDSSTGGTATDQIFDLSHVDHPAAVVSADAMDLDAVYSSSNPAPQTVGTKIFLPSMAKESLKFMPVPRQNSSTNFSDADLDDLLPVPSFPCLLQQPEGAESKDKLGNSRSFNNVSSQNAGSLGQVRATSSDKQEEQRVICNEAVRNVPGSTQVGRPYIFVDGFGILPAGCPIIPTTTNINSSNVLPDGTNRVPAARPTTNPTSISTAFQQLFKRSVRHVDQGYNFNGPAIPYLTSNDAASPEVKSALDGVPVSISDPVAEMNPAINTDEPSLINNAPNKLPGGSHNGSGGGIDNSGNYSPGRGTSPHPGTFDDSGVSTRHSRRKLEQKSNDQQQEHEQQCPADSIITAVADGTGSLMSHSSLYYSDGESSQGALAYNKMNPDDITFEELSKMFIYKQNAAAEKMGIGSTTLKKICRRLGLTRWPSRHLKSLIKLRDTLTTDPEIIEKFPEEERRRALTEIENSLHGRAVTKCLKDFRQKVFKNTHTLKSKSGGVKKKK